MPSCNRNHPKKFMVTYGELRSQGGLALVKRCAFIIGTTAHNKAVLCGDYPRDEDLPISFLVVDANPTR